MKRGQAGAGGAGALIAIITGLIILYILFLPPQERAELLEANYTGPDGEKASTYENATLLQETIGRVDYLADDSFSKAIPNIFLRQVTSAEIIAEFNPFVVRNGWFDKQTANISFRIDDLEHISNVQLSFGAQTHKGVLSIYLNGNKIFEADLKQYNIQPITLDHAFLKTENRLAFQVSGVGGAFWSTNEYQLDNVKITADISDVSGQTSSSVFNMEGFEYFNLKEARLIFVPFCKGVTDVGPLEIHINNNNVYSAIPLCQDRSVVNLPIDIFNAGQNNIRFKTTRGSYAVEQIRVAGNLEDVGSLIKYFEVSEDQYQDILDDKIEPVLVLDFVDDGSRKRATLNVNGHLNEIDQYEKQFTWNIKNYVQEHSNYIKLEPKATLEIVSLKVELR